MALHIGEREDLKLGQESRDRLLFGELTLCLRAGMRQGGVSAWCMRQGHESVSLVVRSPVGDHCPSRRPPQDYTSLGTVFRCTHGKVMGRSCWPRAPVWSQSQTAGPGSGPGGRGRSSALLFERETPTLTFSRVLRCVELDGKEAVLPLCLSWCFKWAL